MDDAALVGIAQPVGDLVDDVQLPDHRERHVVSNQRAERVAIDVLHGDVQLPVVVADVVDRDDVGVLETARRLGLAHEAAAQVLAVDPEELERHVPIDDGVARQVQHTHAAFPEEAFDFVPADDGGHLAHERS